MELYIFYLIAIIGLSLIIYGTLIISKKTKYTSYSFILGGICLLIYSVYKRDYIFIILQSVFILASIYLLIKIKNKK